MLQHGSYIKGMETGEYFYQALDRYFQGLRKNTSIHMEIHMIWQALITRNLWICSEKMRRKWNYL